MNRIVLGTTQFGMDYGVNNKRGQIPQAEVYKILETASQVGVDTLDTASTYGDSERLIGQYIKESGRAYNIISKVGQPGREGARASLVSTLEKLGIQCLYGYLVHRFHEYLDVPEIWQELKKLKNEGKTRKIGFSLYFPGELETIFERQLDVDLIQVPYNIFDRRFEPYFPKLKEKGIEVHVRSVFWQGLVFKRAEALGEKLTALKDGLNKLEEIAQQEGISRATFCFNFVFKNMFVDKIVLGIDGIEHFIENVQPQSIKKDTEGALNNIAPLPKDEISKIYSYLIELVKARSKKKEK